LTESINPPAQRGGWLGVNSCRKLSNYFAWLYSHINKDEYFLTQPHPFPRQDRIEAIKSYEEHNRRVRALVPPHRLLEFNLKTDGWESLCQFMNVTDADCPTTPFPRSNSIRSVQIQAFVAQLTPIVVLAWATVYYVLRRSGRRACKVD
jgi:Sulfotransferase domain